MKLNSVLFVALAAAPALGAVGGLGRAPYALQLDVSVSLKLLYVTPEPDSLGLLLGGGALLCGVSMVLGRVSKWRK